MKKRTVKIITCALLLLAAACTGAPPPAPQLDPPPPAPSDTPAPDEDGEGYPIVIETEPGYPPPEVPAEDPGYPGPGDELTEDPGAYPAPDEGECVPEAPAAQDHELITTDAVQLAGTFYPAAGCRAPLVVLFHQFGSTREAWTDLALWLQNRSGEGASNGGGLAAPAVQFGWFPPLPAHLSFAVFAVDFRDHGDSQAVNGGLDTSGFLVDADSTLAYAKGLPGVDPSRVITMGASIGADASVDACLTVTDSAVAADQANEGCIGALPLSPGNFLGVSYVDVVTRLAETPFDVNIHCVAAEQDGNAPDLCGSEVPGRHSATIYPGRSEHGIALLDEGFDPDIGQVIFDFLMETLGIEG